MEVDIRMTRARSQLIQQHAFFGSLAMRLIVAERNDIQTMATDGKWLFYSRKFLDSITESVILFVVAHEVLHCALGHMVRRQGRDPKLWNIACDYVVNWMLKEAGFAVPDWVFIDPQYAGLNAEEIYHILEQQAEAPEPVGPPQSGPPQQEDDNEADNDSGNNPYHDPDSGGGDDNLRDNSGTNEPDDGSDTGNGSGGKPKNDAGDSQETGGSGSQNYPPTYGDPGGCGEILDAAPPHDAPALAEAADEWKVYTRQAANVARRIGEGKLPGFIEEVIETLDAPQIDWRIVLRRFVDPSRTLDYSWTQPNRRMMSLGYYTPGLVSDGVHHAALIVDSSYSVDELLLAKFGGENQGLLDEGGVDKITVLFVDECVQRATEYVKGDVIDFTVPGRGGTKFAPAFEWLNKNAPDITAAIYFTDLECDHSDFGPAPNYPVLWAAYGHDPRQLKKLMDSVPFGECVELK